MIILGLILLIVGFVAPLIWIPAMAWSYRQATVDLARRFSVPIEVMKARLTLFAARRRSFRPKGWVDKTSI